MRFANIKQIKKKSLIDRKLRRMIDETRSLIQTHNSLFGTVTSITIEQHLPVQHITDHNGFVIATLDPINGFQTYGD